MISSTTSIRAPTILVIDADTSALRDFERAGAVDGWDVLTAPNAHDAAPLLGEFAVDVVAAAHWLPGWSGVELLAELRASRPNVARVLLVNVRSRALAARAVMEGGVHAVVEKPCHLPVLVSTVRQAAGLARSMRLSAAATPDPAAAARVFRRQ